jgi:NAD(P)-dependent dehydrogenase (short-subunit alcohol dehydrogenase family)
VLFVKCDVANWDDQVQVFKRALAHSPNGGVDIVVANAAVVKDDEFFQG